MTSDRQVSGIVRRWLHEPVRLEDEGLRHVLRALPTTPQMRIRRAQWLPFPRSRDRAGYVRSPQATARLMRILVLLVVTGLAAGAIVLSAGSTSVPIANPVLAGGTAITAGDAHTCVVLDEGRVACWGENASGELGDGSTIDRDVAVDVSGASGVTAVAATTSGTCALVADGRTTCWGDGSLTPLEVAGLDNPTVIAGGVGRTCAIVSGAHLACWTSGSRRAVEVPGIVGATALAVGYFETCAILEAGPVQCWPGEGGMPVEIAGLKGAVALAAGQESMGPPHTCAIVEAGHVRCWGGNEYLQLGDGDPTDRIVEEPVDVVDITGATVLAAGGAHTCAVVAGGHVRCWGWNFNGELGDPAATASAVSIPVEVVGLEGASAVAMGWAHTCAIVADGLVRCWGRDGLLGGGVTTAHAGPMEVVGPGGR